MRFLPVLALLLTAPAWAADPVTAPEETGEYRILFNSTDLTGWDGDTRLWSVKEGVIHGETTKENAANGNTFLIWKEGSVKNFELRLTFRSSNTNNSGIQYRSKHFTENPRNAWVVRGYQHEIRNENTLPNVSGFIYDEGGKRGRVCLAGEKAVWEEGKKKVVETLFTADEYKQIFNLDGWNEVVIIARDRHIQHFTNGHLVLDFTDAPETALLEGVLALQLHAGNPMWVEFKNIKLKSLE